MCSVLVVVWRTFTDGRCAVGAAVTMVSSSSSGALSGYLTARSVRLFTITKLDG